MDIWHTCEADKVGTEGWLGRVAREFDPKKENVVTAVSFGPCLFRALVGARRSGRLRGRPAGAVRLPADRSRTRRSGCRCSDRSRHDVQPSDRAAAVMDYLGTTGLDSLKGADILKVAPGKYKSDGAVPEHADRPKLKGIAQVHLADLGTRIFYCDHGSFDTHAGQDPLHASLWTAVTEGLEAFMADLREHDEADNVIVLMFSEFGRRVRDNGSGTDHGAGGVDVRARREGQGRALRRICRRWRPSKLVQGDLNPNMDFRSIYSTILDKWLQPEPGADRQRHLRAAGLPELGAADAFPRLPRFPANREQGRRRARSEPNAFRCGRRVEVEGTMALTTVARGTGLRLEPCHRARRGDGHRVQLRPDDVPWTTNGDIYTANRGNENNFGMRVNQHASSAAPARRNCSPISSNTARATARRSGRSASRSMTNGPRLLLGRVDEHDLGVRHRRQVHHASSGKTGSGDGELLRPAGLAVEKNGNLIVVDSGNNRLQVFTPEGKFVGKCGRAGKGQGEFNQPWGITLDKDGNIYVADWKNHRVQKLSPEGKSLMSIGQLRQARSSRRAPMR